MRPGQDLLFVALALTAAVGCRGRRPPDDHKPPDATTIRVDASVVVAPAEPPPNATTIALVHTANVRGQLERWGRPPHALGGAAARAALLTALRKDRLVLAVDAGDLLLPPRGEVPFLDDDLLERERRAKTMLEATARMGLAGIVPGETDLSLGASRLAELARAAKVPFLCANLVGADGAPVFDASRIVELGGIKIGLFGLLSLAAPARAAIEQTGTRLLPAADAARTTVGALQAAGATVIVALMHLEGGATEASAVVTATPRIDAVILGHGGTLTSAPLSAAGVPVVEAGFDGKRMGRLELHVAGGKAHPGTHHLHEIDVRSGQDAPTTALVARYAKATGTRAEAGKLTGADPRLANAELSMKKGARPPLKEDWSYGSTGVCVGCHQEEDAQWKTTSHAFAQESLVPLGRTGDPECLFCHTTAFLRRGGTRSLATAQKYFPDVGCESCHGPSVAHVRAAKKKGGTLLHADVQTCRGCHPSDRGGQAFDVAGELKQQLGPGHGMPATAVP